MDRLEALLTKELQIGIEEPNKRVFILQAIKRKVDATVWYDSPYYDSEPYDNLISALKDLEVEVEESAETYRQLDLPNKLYISTEENVWENKELMDKIRNSPYVIVYPTPPKVKRIKKVK